MGRTAAVVVATAAATPDLLLQTARARMVLRHTPVPLAVSRVLELVCWWSLPLRSWCYEREYCRIDLVIGWYGWVWA